MPGMDEFICIPTENIPMKTKEQVPNCVFNDHSELGVLWTQIWEWDKNLDDFKALVNNLRSEYQESRAIAVEYLIERCKRAEWKK